VSPPAVPDRHLESWGGSEKIGVYGPYTGSYRKERTQPFNGCVPNPPSLGCKSQNPIQITTTTITLFNSIITIIIIIIGDTPLHSPLPCKVPQKDKIQNPV